MKECWLNYSILCNQRATCTYILHRYIYMHAYTYISALLVWRVVHNSDVIGFVVSDLVVRNVICM